MSITKKVEIPMAIILIAGITMVLDRFINIPTLSMLSNSFQQWAVIVTGFALGVGLVNLNLVHGRRIINKRTDWLWSIYLLGLLWIMLIIGLVSINHPIYQWLFNYVYSVAGPTMWSLLAFYIISASFRAFRARNLETSLLLITAIFVLLDKAPIGASIWPGFVDIGEWLINVPQLAGRRAVTMGAALGGTALGLRILIGSDKTALGIMEEE